MKCTTMRCSVKRILVGIDGSEPSLRAARKAAEFAHFFDASVTLLHVIAPANSSYYVGKPTDKVMEEQKAKEQLRPAINIMKDARVMFDTRTAVGHPAEVILNLAEGYDEESEYDLIVLGTKGTSGISRFLIGSVAERVTQYSKIPVLAVP